MVHGILQFTPSIAFRYVLHRCESRDIRCRESFWILNRDGTAACGRTAYGAAAACSFRFVFLGAVRAGVSLLGHGRRVRTGRCSRARGLAGARGRGRPPPRDVFLTRPRVVLLGRFRQ